MTSYLLRRGGGVRAALIALIFDTLFVVTLGVVFVLRILGVGQEDGGGLGIVADVAR